MALAGCGGAGLGAGSRGSADLRPAHGVPARTGALPRGFIGVVAPDVFAGGGAYQRRQLHIQAAAGVGLIRQTFDWSQIQPGGGPPRFGPYDRFVLAAARAGISVLPILFDTPRALSSAPARATRDTYPPRDPATMAAFAAALVARYGPAGSLWRAHPGVRPSPIRAWQIWNEPNLPVYWGGHPSAAAYAALLEAAYRSIRRADPGAEVVTAGLPDSRIGVPFFAYLAALYRAGAAPYFDVLAINPYAVSVGGISEALSRTRALMSRYGDAAKPLWVTEVGWASGGPGSSFTVGPSGQARLVGQLLDHAPAWRVRWRLRGLVYYAWRDEPVYPGGRDFWGLHTGLLNIAGHPKPALAALRAASARLG